MQTANQKKKVILRIIFFTLMIANMILIFGFSSDNGEISGGKSKIVIEFIAKIVKQENNEVFLKTGEHIIRKAAHFTEYATLGIWTFLAFNTFNISNNKKLIISVLICCIYAATDEFHQSFSPRKVTASKRCIN